MQHYSRFAFSGLGGAFIEATAVSPEGRIGYGCTGIWNDDHIEGLKKITKISKDNFLNSSTAISINNLNRKKLSQFGTELKKISFNVKYGEILGIAGVAGNGQVELMNALSGETLGAVSYTHLTLPTMS